MAIYTFPSTLLRADSISFTLQSISTSTPQSAFNPLVFSDGPTSEFWSVAVEIILQEADDWREVAALLRKFRGRRNKVRLFDISRTLRGAGASGPTINAAADAAAGLTSIEVTGLTASQAVALAADDMIGIGENLYAVSDAASSDGSGNATINILPPLRQGIADGDAVNLSSPTGLFMLTAGANSQTIIPPTVSQPLQLQFIESPDFE